MSVLVIEGEPAAAAYLKKGLHQNGFNPCIAENALQALYLATTREYEMIVLDVAGPQTEGWSILTSMRAVGRNSPVILLAGQGASSDSVRGLNLGADDYLPRPFALAELLARMRAVMRRTGERPDHGLRLGDLEVDPMRRRVTRARLRIELSVKEFALLVLLLRNAGTVLARTTIAEEVWGMQFDSGTNLIDVAVRRLRSKVDDPYPRKLIHSVRGIGYVIEER